MQNIEKNRALTWYQTMVTIRDFENIIDEKNRAGFVWHDPSL
jgi:pyruvate dehydrogenase E1 component alpha subunit